MKLTHWDENCFTKSESEKINKKLTEMRLVINKEQNPMKKLIRLENFYESVRNLAEKTRWMEK